MADKPLVAAGLDAGSTFTRAVICVVEGDRIRLAGYGVRPSEGWSRSRLADHHAVSECMREALQDAERMSGQSVGSVVLGIGGATISSHNSHAVYEFGYQREITAADLRRAIERAARVVLPPDRMILHVLPQEFAVDGNPGHLNPCGLMGSKIEAYVHLVMVSMRERHELVGAANRAHVAVEETVFEPLAAAYAALLPYERREGILVLDMGSQSTELLVHYGDAVFHSGSLPVCGDHFTWDVARGLRMTCEEAEAVKQQYGCALLDLTAPNSSVVLPGEPGRGPRERPRRDLNLILEARGKELFEWVRRELARISMEQSLVGAVLTGGAARLAGLCDLAERSLGCRACNGLPVGIKDWPEELNTPAWTTAAGLAMYAARRKFLGGQQGGNGFFRSLWG